MSVDESPNLSHDSELTASGNCHCGAFKFIVKLADLEHISSCDCSLCSRNAYLWASPASKNDFTVVKGKGSLKDYRHGTQNHKFCPVCSTSVLCCNAADDEIISVNVRALADVDPNSLKATLTPCGVINARQTNAPASDGLHADCYCGAISYTLRAAPLATKSCNCSLCSRDGAVWVYPLIADVEVHTQKSLVEYMFGRNIIVHGFCGVCSVHVWEKFLNPAKAHTIGLNCRAFNGFDYKKLPTKVHNGKATPPQYEV
ncbi:hypothetical protein DFH06DRAFT_623740 [Mycena polygramma]|nr:hypothetical protein DFH06DRAFT_623740 [Mycena polygramma]